MASDLTNFLPEDRLRSIRRAYLFRLGAVLAGCLAILVVLHGVLLLPSYLFLADKATAERSRIDDLSASLASSGGADVASRLAGVRGEAGTLLSYASSTAASDLLAAVLAAPHTGITLSALSYASAPAKLVITGSAATREALRAYDASLAALPYVSGADLPLSAYAQDTDIPFVITLTGALTP